MAKIYNFKSNKLIIFMEIEIHKFSNWNTQFSEHKTGIFLLIYASVSGSVR
jgi:hypothetical protein